MKDLSFFLAGGGSVAYAFEAPGVCHLADNIEGRYQVGQVRCFDEPQPGWAPCSAEAYEAVRAQVLSALGLIDENAPFLALCDAFDAQEAALLPF